MATKTMIAVAEYMKQHDIKFMVGAEGQNLIKTGFGGLDNVGTLETVLVFDENERFVELMTLNYSNVPEGKLEQVVMELNRLNKQYRWVTFYADEDNKKITAKISAMLESESCGERAVELVQRLIGICNKAYPDIMQAMWE